ncbi:futalosine hydrolase [Streptomyces sp. SAJ15]|uniref:futalosine hydrolase n=1 Tax=Streptomyces sp. SAJ15 TaxID=2011095 RepID=UPI0021B1FBFA|nr:futalosine hydrolase [Streptomyces sp. SAJ15]
MALQPQAGVLTDGRILVVTAVAAERDAVVRGVGASACPVDASPTGGPTLPDAGGTGRGFVVIEGGVGPAAAAAATATALASAAARGTGYALVVSAGIGGGFPGAPVGSLVVADTIVAADLGAETADGFASVAELGFGTVTHCPPPALAAAAAEATGAARGSVLTVSTVTGSAERAAALLARHPDAAAEAMEGFGVAEAAAAHGLPVLEVRAVSNAVGPRDRAAWRIGAALDALATAFGGLVPVIEGWKEPGRHGETDD